MVYVNSLITLSVTIESCSCYISVAEKLFVVKNREITGFKILNFFTSNQSLSIEICLFNSFTSMVCLSTETSRSTELLYVRVI
jgi:hypothetical protein